MMLVHWIEENLPNYFFGGGFLAIKKKQTQSPAITKDIQMLKLRNHQELTIKYALFQFF